MFKLLFNCYFALYSSLRDTGPTMASRRSLPYQYNVSPPSTSAMCCVSRWRTGVDQYHTASSRDERLRGGRCGEPARALCPHAATLGARPESHADEGRQLTSEVTYRIWRVYMSASIYAFLTGRVNVYQALLAKPDRGDSHLPLTRDDWYV